MNINLLIKNTLVPCGVPVEFQSYTGKLTKYITFFCYNEQGEAWAEDKEIETGFYIQVDVWSKDDYTDLVEQVQAAMIAAGFYRRTAHDLYEKDTKIFHKAMRFVFMKEIMNFL